MIIKKVTLRNFGPFLGEHSLDLTTLPEKPLILVGALNGGGKTSILEATRLTLYGSECGNGKLRSMKYKDYRNYIQSQRRRNLQRNQSSPCLVAERRDNRRVYQRVRWRGTRRSP